MGNFVKAMRLWETYVMAAKKTARIKKGNFSRTERRLRRFKGQKSSNKIKRGSGIAVGLDINANKNVTIQPM